MKTSICLFFLLVFVHHFYAQNNLYLGINNITISQPNPSQLKLNLKVTGATYGEYLSYKTEINQNEIILHVCYAMTGAGVTTNFDNDFYIDISATPSNYNLKTNIYYSDAAICTYINLDDTATLSFTTPIIGTVSLNSTDFNIKNREVHLFPNPVKDILNVKSSSKINQVNIYDASGKQVYEVSSPKENKIDVTKLENGIYYLEVISSSKKWREKFVKK